MFMHKIRYCLGIHPDKYNLHTWLSPENELGLVSTQNPDTSDMNQTETTSGLLQVQVQFLWIVSTKFSGFASPFAIAF